LDRKRVERAAAAGAARQFKTNGLIPLWPCDQLASEGAPMFLQHAKRFMPISRIDE